MTRIVILSALLCISLSDAHAAPTPADQIKDLEQRLADALQENAKLRTQVRTGEREREEAIAAATKGSKESVEKQTARFRREAEDANQRAENIQREFVLLQKSFDELKASVMTGAPTTVGAKRTTGDVININRLIVVQVIDADSALVLYGVPAGRHEVFRLNGIDTSEIVDGATIRLAAPIKLTGTYQYETTNGSNTIWEADYQKPGK